MIIFYRLEMRLHKNEDYFLICERDIIEELEEIKNKLYSKSDTRIIKITEEVIE